MEEIDHSLNAQGCCLCKTTSKHKNTNETYIQALNELDFQETETKQILEHQQSYRAELEALIKGHKETINHLRVNFNEINSYTSDYEAQLMKHANQKGFIDAQILQLKERLTLAAELDEKMRKKDELQKEITDLDGQLIRLESARKKHIQIVKNKISEKVINILSKDGGFEPSFDNAQKFEFDFASDSMRLDNRANFSASSNVILKNAFHLATLLTAVEDDRFRIPCFSMFDNIEDKGMREERSQNFQRIIAEEVGELKGDFQVIMTTSMVDPTLNNDKYGTGPYYIKGTHTLNM